MFDPSDLVDKSIVDAKIIEDYKADWKRRGFPDVDLSPRTQGGDMLNEPVGQPSLEAELWTAVIKEAVADYQKTSGWWNKACTDCHDGQRCSREQKRKYRGGKPGEHINSGTFEGRKPCPHSHTYHDCAVRWFTSRNFKEICIALGIDVGWFYKQIGMKEKHV